MQSILKAAFGNPTLVDNLKTFDNPRHLALGSPRTFDNSMTFDNPTLPLTTRMTDGNPFPFYNPTSFWQPDSSWQLENLWQTDDRWPSDSSPWAARRPLKTRWPSTTLSPLTTRMIVYGNPLGWRARCWRNQWLVFGAFIVFSVSHFLLSGNNMKTIL